MCRGEKKIRGRKVEEVWTASNKPNRLSEPLAGQTPGSCSLVMLRTQAYARELDGNCYAVEIDVCAVLALPALHLPELNKQRKCSKYCSKSE